MSQNIWSAVRANPALFSDGVTIVQSCQTEKPRNSAKIDSHRLRWARRRPVDSHCRTSSGSWSSTQRPDRGAGMVRVSRVMSATLGARVAGSGACRCGCVTVSSRPRGGAVRRRTTAATRGKRGGNGAPLYCSRDGSRPDLRAQRVLLLRRRLRRRPRRGDGPGHRPAHPGGGHGRPRAPRQPGAAVHQGRDQRGLHDGARPARTGRRARRAGRGSAGRAPRRGAGPGRGPLRATIAEHGPDSVAVYVSGRCRWRRSTWPTSS